MQIADHAFIVTGGGSGLGAATIRMLVRGGAKVMIADINVEGGTALVSELGEQVGFIRADVTQEAAMQNVVTEAVAHFGGVHGLVNCAGIVSGERVVGKNGPHRLDSFVRAIQINLVGTFNAIRLAATVMVANSPELDGERGVIINTASIAAFDGQIGQAAYAASKGGIVGMTLPLARDLARDGVRVVTIAPGIFETPMMAGTPEEVQTSLGKAVPFPSRLGKASEYAHLVQHIIENVMLNGEVIRLDGAIRMQPK